MKRTLIALLLLALPALSSSAIVSESHKKAAEALLIAMEYDATSKQLIESMIHMEIKQNPQLSLYENTLRAFFSKFLSYKAIKKDLIDVYTSELSEAELIEITNFFSSKAGKKFVAKRAVLFQKGAMIGQKRIQHNLVELERMIQEETRRIKALQSSTAR